MTGGSLLVTTIDARVAAEKLMESGKVGTEEAKRDGIVVEVGGGEPARRERRGEACEEPAA